MKKNLKFLSFLGLSAFLCYSVGLGCTGANAEILESHKEISYWLNDEQKHYAEELTSIFENGTPEIDYEYAEDLGDGRGITCGRAGFCTGTGDAVQVVEKYTDLKPNNILAKYLPELKRLENERIKTSNDQGNVAGISKIGDFFSDWDSAAKDSEFRKVQDSIVDEVYYKPSAEKADKLGLKLALSRAQLYDTIIQHGDEDNDPDSIDALIERTNKKTGGTPADAKIKEKILLKNFLAERKATLLCCYKEESREEWAESYGRVDVFSDLLKNRNYNLEAPVIVKSSMYGDFELDKK